VVTIDLASTFALIREQRDKLNASDDALFEVIRHVESALTELRPGVSADVQCAGVDLDDGFWLVFGKKSGQWRIMWARGDEDDPQPLSDMSREIRANVFAATPEGPSAIELLILGVANSVMQNIKLRTPLVERAQALSAAIAALGFTKPTNP
jgi:hypothetical protein